MGDRCYMNMTVREEDANKLEDELGTGETMELASPAVTIGFDEVNYGAFTERGDLARNGLVFYGWHGAGGAYGPHEFAAYGGTMIDIPVTHESGDYFVSFNPKTRKVAKREIEQIKKYLALLKKAKAYIKRKVK